MGDVDRDWVWERLDETIRKDKKVLQIVKEWVEANEDYDTCDMKNILYCCGWEDLLKDGYIGNGKNHQFINGTISVCSTRSETTRDRQSFRLSYKYRDGGFYKIYHVCIFHYIIIPQFCRCI